MSGHYSGLIGYLHIAGPIEYPDTAGLIGYVHIAGQIGYSDTMLDM